MRVLVNSWSCNKYQRSGYIMRDSFFLIHFRCWKSMVKMLANSLPGRLRTSHFHLIVPRGRKGAAILPFLWLFLQRCKTHHGSPNIKSFSKPNYLLQALLPNTITFRISIPSHKLPRTLWSKVNEVLASHLWSFPMLGESANIVIHSAQSIS